MFVWAYSSVPFFFIESVGYIARVECYVAHGMGFPCERINLLIVSDASVSRYPLGCRVRARTGNSIPISDQGTLFFIPLLQT